MKARHVIDYNDGSYEPRIYQIMSLAVKFGVMKVCRVLKYSLCSSVSSHLFFTSYSFTSYFELTKLCLSLSMGSV